MKTRLLRLSVALVAMLALGSPAWAQSSLRGSIKDSTGAVVPGATVTLTNVRTADVRAATTDHTGSFYIAGLVPATYTVKVELAGFKTLEQRVTINPRDTRGFDAVLEVGSQSETVTVAAETEIIQTETGAREGVLSAKQIDNLSIIGRSSLELLRIMPGVVAPDQRDLETVGFDTGSNNTSAYTVNGIRGTNNVVSLDGSNMMDPGANDGVIISPNPDMVESVKIQSSNFAAEYGSAGVHVSAITKGGSNEFHGNVYGYARHHSLAANDRSNSIAGIDKPKSAFYYPGANLGGPLIKDKLFFFGAFEYQKQNADMGTRFGVVPTLAQRNGDFSEFASPRGSNLLQPTSVNIPGGFPGAGNPAPNNNLAPYIDPVGRALINQYPVPDYVDPLNRFNYTGDELRKVDRWESALRLDYNISESTKAYMRLAYSRETYDQPRGLWWDTGPYALPTPIRGSNNGRSAVLNVVSVINPTMTNEVLLSYSKLQLNNDFADPAAMSLEGNGIGGWSGFYGNQVSWIPLNVTPWNDQGIGDFAFNGNPMFAHNDAWQISDNLTWVKDTHVLKFGFALEQLNKKQNFQNNEEGQMEVASWGQPGSTGSTLGNLLTGNPVSFRQGTILPEGHFRQYNIAGYAQDSWKLRKNFTLEAGVRFSYMPNNTEVNGLGAIFRPELYQPSQGAYLGGDITQLNGMAYAPEDVPNGLIPNRGTFWMPRLNFAWDVKDSGDLVVRGGAGVFYNRPQGNAEYDVIRLPPNGYQSYYNPWGEVKLNNLTSVDPYSIVGGQAIDSNNPDSKEYPRIFSTSLSVAKRLPLSQVLEVGYVGTFGRHLLNHRQTNVVPRGTFLQGQVGNADLSIPSNRAALDDSVTRAARPYPSLGEVRYWEFAGTSNYHSLQATLSRQTSDRLQYFLTYTFSKALGAGNVNETDGSAYLDPYDIRNRTWGVLPTDRTHILNASYNWNVPDGVSETSSGFAKALLNGWQVSGISTFTSGQPIRLRFSGDLSNGGDMALAWEGSSDAGQGTGSIGTGFVAPIIGSGIGAGGKSPGEKLLDVGQVSIAPFPDSGPYNQAVYIRAPNRMFHDVTLMKNFPVGAGGKKLQFRLGCFNCFNMAYATPTIQDDIDLRLTTVCNARVDAPNGAGGTANVCNPTAGFHFDDATLQNFGKVNLLRGHRVIELALKFYF